MAETQPTPASEPVLVKPVRRWHQKWWFRTLTGLVVFIILLFLALPFAAKYSLKHWLEKNGADQAEIDAISYNPFQSRVSLRGLAAGHGGQTLLSNGVFTIDLGLKRLFSRDIHIEEAAYHDLLLDIEQRPDGSWRFGTYSLTPGEQAKEESQASDWIFSARDVSLANCQIHFKTPDIDLTLLVNEARLSNFSTSADADPATLVLRGTLNGQAVDIQLDALRIAPSLALNGRVKIDAFDLAIVKKYVEKALPDFAGKVTINGKGAFSLEQGAMRADYDGLIALAQPLVGNQTFNSAASALSWNGAVSYHAAANDSGVTTKGTLAASGLTAAVPGAGFAIKHEQISLSGESAVPLAPALSVTHNGTLATSGTVVNVQKMKIQQQRFNWQGKAQWAMVDGVSRPQFSGAVTSGGTRYENDGMQAGVENTTVAELTGDIAGKKITVKSAAARGLSFAMAMPDGKKTANMSASVAVINIGAVATNNFIDWQTRKIGVQNLAAKLPSPMPLSLSLANVDIDQISSSAKAAVWQTGSLSMRQFVAQSPRQKGQLASLGSAKISDIKATKNGEANIGGIELNGMYLLGSGKKDAMSGFDRLTLRRFAFSPTKGLAAASVRLNGLSANLARDEKGTFNVLAAIAALTDDKTAKKPAPAVATKPVAKEEKKAGKPLPIRIQEAALDGHIAYSDKSLPMPFTADAAIETLSVKNIDSANPAQKSPVELVAQLAGRAPFNVKGEVALFAEKPNIALDIHLKNYPLSNLSPYTAMAVGTALASGELKLDATVSLENNYLKVANKILLQKLETKTLSPELAAQLNNQLPMPLDAALALLRDNNRNITLDIPVEGDLSSLNVGISSIIITALGKAIIPAASAYLVYALGPYGALAYVGMKVGQKMMQVTLPPVEFEPGKAELSLLKDDYLQRVGKVLADRPETDLQLVPQAVASEFSPPAKDGKAPTTPPSPELTKKLEDLGQRRAQALRQRLHDQTGVAMNRLMISETQIVPDGKPQVLLGL